MIMLEIFIAVKLCNKFSAVITDGQFGYEDEHFLILFKNFFHKCEKMCQLPFNIAIHSLMRGLPRRHKKL